MVKVYFHGRPAGQDFWSAENQIINSDLIYLKSFLDYKVGSKESSVMVVDQINGNSYYTYLHRRNFFEKGGRSDSYSAITVCLEKKSCRKVSSLYNLLDQAYDSLINNNILSKTSNEEKFLINTYSEKSDILAKCSDAIKSNLAKIEMSDNVVINVDTRESIGTLYSLKEVDSELFREDVKKTKIIISADYQPRCTNLQIQIDKLKQQLAQIEQKHAKVLEEKEKAHREKIKKYEELLSAKETHILSLEAKLKKAEDRIKELEKLLGNTPLLKKWEELKPQIENFVSLWTQKFQIKQGGNSPKPTILSISKIVTYTNTLLLVVILFLLSLNKCEAPASVDIPEYDSNPTESVVENQTKQSQQTETSESEEYTTTENLDNESVNTYTINIVGYNGTGKLKPQMQYPLNLSGVQIPCEFYLEKAPSGTKIEGNRLITGLDGGEIVICGKGDGFNVEPRTLVIGDVLINKNRTVIKNGKQTIMTDGNRTVITDQNGNVTIDTELGTGNSTTSSSKQ